MKLPFRPVCDGMRAVPPPQTPPTLRELARLAGVSHTTVSLSLRNHPSIPEATRERIRRLADARGYRSNVLVSALMSQVRLKRHKTAPEVVGFLTGGPTADEWQNHSANVGFFDGARRRAQQLGMRIEPFWLGPGGKSAAATCHMLRTRAITGNLISPFAVPVYDHALDWSHLICVGLGYVYNQHRLHRATHNHFRGALLAYQKLTERGYRRIGLALDAEQNRRVNYTWLGGFLAARETFGGRAVPPLLTTEGRAPAQMQRWMKRHRPDAVIGFGPAQLRGLTDLGYTIPDDLAFAALDVEQARLVHVEEVSGINQNLPLIGATAIDILASQLYHNEVGLPQRPVYSMIEGYWEEGRTAPPRPSASR